MLGIANATPRSKENKVDLILITLPRLIFTNISSHIVEGALIILALFGFFLYQLIKTKTLHPAAGGLLITIGICFTFYGISIGLANFDPDEIDESLPELIAGIKTAFLVSVLGVLFSIILRVTALAMDYFRKQEVVDEGVGIEDLVALQKQAVDAQKAQAQSLQLLTESNNKNFVQMSESFDNFARTMAENNSKAFIQALQDVIKDFNNKITEQFGDNFKQLNMAVGALLEWQKNYKEYVERSEKNLNMLYIKIDKAMKDYTTLLEHTSKFADHANALKALLDGALSQRENLEKNIQNLSTFLKSMQDTIPNLIKNINLYQNTSLQNIKQIQEHSQNLEKHYVDVTSKLTQSIDANINQLTQHFKENTGKLTDSILKINDNLLKGSQAINSQIKVLDDELENVLKHMGVNLASISGKFVDDYQKIINFLNLKMGK